MRSILFIASALVLVTASNSTRASAPSYEDYLDRLRDVCAVECLQPRQFQREARKRGRGQSEDMALIMDVRFARRAGPKLELHNINLDLADVGVAQNGPTLTHPNVIVVELDYETLSDIINPPTVSAPSPDRSEEEGLIVEGQRQTEKKDPTFAQLRARFLNRRIAVRGQPRLEIRWIGGRRDFRRKQVVLQVDNADDIVLLPRYDDDGNPVIEEGLGN